MNGREGKKNRQYVESREFLGAFPLMLHTLVLCRLYRLPGIHWIRPDHQNGPSVPGKQREDWSSDPLNTHKGWMGWGCSPRTWEAEVRDPQDKLASYISQG